MVVDFIIPLPLEGTFSYRIPESMTREFAIGKRALVPFGPKKILTAIAFCEHQGEPPEDKKVPHRRGNQYLLIEDYGTPLGVDVAVNHVGDCFD